MDYLPLSDAHRAPKAATRATTRSHEEFTRYLPFSDRTSFADAQRGFIASLDPLTIAHERSRRPAFDLSQATEFLQADAPDTVNPSLWRQAQLNGLHNGLFEVADGLYQVRSFDIANMTLIRGDTGWVVIDPLTSSETSRAALALANQHLGERPVKAVVITHSHSDHFAGILGVTDHAAVVRGDVQVIAPEHFVNEALSENVLAGNVMGRRATYMYGNLLPPSPTGFVTAGLGAALALGSTGFIVPTDLVRESGETRLLDGVTFEFQMTPGTEAPAEFVFYLPDFKALCMAEITSHHLHNVYTPRGAQVRDALAWSAQINESLDRFGDRLEIQFACHHWPIWGRERACRYLANQRDLYKFLHDQTLRLANQGYSPEEIAEHVTLPDSLGQDFSNRGYYGTVRHNVRAVYVKYLGYFNGNPATLNPLPAAESGTRYVRCMGGEEAVLEHARTAFADGDYRWVVELLNHVMMTNPGHEECRALQADALEQLGYQAESAPWRNFYLCGALELREGLPASRAFVASDGMVRGMPLANVFLILAVRLNPTKVGNRSVAINVKLSDLEEEWLLTVHNCVMQSYPGRQAPEADVTLTLPGLEFKRLMLGLADAAALTQAGVLQVQGDIGVVAQLLGWMDEFERRFPIVTPRLPAA